VGRPLATTSQSSSTRTRPAAHARDLRRLRALAGDEAPVIGVGVETAGTDAGAAHSFDPAFPCHQFVLGAGKYGLTQLQNLAQVPPTGAVVFVGPLRIVGGSGSPTRVLALVER
jgi:kynurenine formamidase